MSLGPRARNRNGRTENENRKRDSVQSVVQDNEVFPGVPAAVAKNPADQLAAWRLPFGYGTPELAVGEATRVAPSGGWTHIAPADCLVFLIRARLAKAHKRGVSRLTNQRKRAKGVTGTSP